MEFPPGITCFQCYESHVMASDLRKLPVDFEVFTHYAGDAGEMRGPKWMVWCAQSVYFC